MGFWCEGGSGRSAVERKNKVMDKTKPCGMPTMQK